MCKQKSSNILSSSRLAVRNSKDPFHKRLGTPSVKIHMGAKGSARIQKSTPG